jgi:hypothetical protein
MGTKSNRSLSMIHIRALLQIIAVIALVFGISPPDTDLNGEATPVPHDTSYAALGGSV